mmetsp:Transcript_17410/g.27220  ORF Transcript_17410/g.27220 Transcript_17410/m.27220 type:complete len:229 (+) Transcript_17410:1201-1887(+)
MKYFLRTFYGLLNSPWDQSKFEDMCRDLFGIKSYVLYTLDKVVLAIMKQIQSIISSNICTQLLAMFLMRAGGWSEEEEYVGGAMELLAEERCFRFYFEEGGVGGKLMMQLVDIANQPEFAQLTYNKEKMSKYLSTYTTSETTSLDIRKHRIFLFRNHRKVSQNQNRSNNQILDFGLECKLCLSTYRLFFVEETEDFLYRKGSRRAARESLPSSRRDTKFRRWLDSLVG